jgi:hypothetical protein
MNAANESSVPVTELPPFHPQCRIFDGRAIAKYRDQLAKAGNGMALVHLGAALAAATGLYDLTKVFQSQKN